MSQRRLHLLTNLAVLSYSGEHCRFSDISFINYLHCTYWRFCYLGHNIIMKWYYFHVFTDIPYNCICRICTYATADTMQENACPSAWGVTTERLSDPLICFASRVNVLNHCRAAVPMAALSKFNQTYQYKR